MLLFPGVPGLAETWLPVARINLSSVYILEIVVQCGTYQCKICVMHAVLWIKAQFYVKVTLYVI